MLNKINQHSGRLVSKRFENETFAGYLQELVKVEQEKIDVENERDSK